MSKTQPPFIREPRGERTAATCANWFDGRCEKCGDPWDDCKVPATRHCIFHSDREQRAP